MNQNDKLHNGTSPELNEEQLESVAGGAAVNGTLKTRDYYCDKCGQDTLHSYYDLPPTHFWDRDPKRMTICSICGNETVRPQNRTLY